MEQPRRHVYSLLKTERRSDEVTIVRDASQQQNCQTVAVSDSTDGVALHSPVSRLSRDENHEMFSPVDEVLVQQTEQIKCKYDDNSCDGIVLWPKSLETCGTEKPPPYECDECHRTFNERRYLKTHRRIHSGDKPYTCEICSKTFTLVSYLRKHRRKHDGRKPFTCYICNKVFSELGHLTAHIFIHTGEKRHVCDVCGKAFTNPSTLTGHRRIHSGEKPFCCDR